MRYPPETHLKQKSRIFSLAHNMFRCGPIALKHYSDVIMGSMASQITSLTIVYSSVYSGADKRKHQSSASLAFVRGIHRRPLNSTHKRPVTRKMFPFDDVIMYCTEPASTAGLCTICQDSWATEPGCYGQTRFEFLKGFGLISYIAQTDPLVMGDVTTHTVGPLRDSRMGTGIRMKNTVFSKPKVTLLVLYGPKYITMTS